MSVFRQAGLIEIMCDPCGSLAGEEFEPSDFQHMIRHAKHDGWKIFEARGVWYHECPECSAPPEPDFEPEPIPRKRFYEPWIEAILGEDHDDDPDTYVPYG